MFLCGCLEPGRDGVGDYSRKLAGEFIRQGNEVSVISLNDPYIRNMHHEDQYDGKEHIPVVRLSSDLEKKEKVTAACLWIDKFDPDLLSLQYVPFSFHKKGIPFGIGTYFKEIFRERKVHLMFHEIWQGESKESTFKDKIVGFVQKRISYSIISSVRPSWISTTNEYYKNCFTGLNIKPLKVPVFSNMPIGNPQGMEVFKLLPQKVILERDKYIVGCFFGSLIDHDELPDRVTELSAMVREQCGKELIITHIGRSGGVKDQLETLSKLTGIETVVLGEWPEQAIADYLANVEIGLTNYPGILYEKSGSIAAFLYNGRPVVFLKESFEKDDRSMEEIKDLAEIKDLGSFYTQNKDFYLKYGVEQAYHKYRTLFNS